MGLQPAGIARVHLPATMGRRDSSRDAGQSLSGALSVGTSVDSSMGGTDPLPETVTVSVSGKDTSPPASGSDARRTFAISIESGW